MTLPQAVGVLVVLVLAVSLVAGRRQRHNPGRRRSDTVLPRRTAWDRAKKVYK